jgi:hypothetical protein
MLLLAAGAALSGCGRMGYEAIAGDASIPELRDADTDATVADAATIPAADAAPDAVINTGACTGPVDCGATSACVAGQCVAAQRVFVSAAASSNADLGGLSAGDALCQSYADAAQLGGIWMAWLSSGAQHARNRLNPSSLPYRRLDGALVASDWNGLTSGALMNPIDVDENLAPLPGSEVWTGTTATGLKTTATCSDWTNGTAVGTLGTVGNTSATDATWSSVYLQFCDRNNVHLYCIEQ